MKKAFDPFDIMMDDEGYDEDDEGVNSEGKYLDCGDDNLL